MPGQTGLAHETWQPGLLAHKDKSKDKDKDKEQSNHIVDCGVTLAKKGNSYI